MDSLSIRILGDNAGSLEMVPLGISNGSVVIIKGTPNDRDGADFLVTTDAPVSPGVLGLDELATMLVEVAEMIRSDESKAAFTEGLESER